MFRIADFVHENRTRGDVCGSGENRAPFNHQGLSIVLPRYLQGICTLFPFSAFINLRQMCSDRIASIPFAEALLLDVVALVPKEEITVPLAPVRDESQKLKYTCVLLRQIAGTVSGVVLTTSTPKIRRVKHRRNRSGITGLYSISPSLIRFNLIIFVDHPSLQRNIEQTVIPAYNPPAPEYAKLFDKQPTTSTVTAPPTRTPGIPLFSVFVVSFYSLLVDVCFNLCIIVLMFLLGEPASTQGNTPPSIAIGVAAAAEETKGEAPGRKGSGGEGARRRSKGDDDEDSDFEAEIDPYLINNDLDPITPQTPRAASRAGWVYSLLFLLSLYSLRLMLIQIFRTMGTTHTWMRTTNKKCLVWTTSRRTWKAWMTNCLNLLMVLLLSFLSFLFP
jgi:hypothetical protein